MDSFEPIRVAAARLHGVVVAAGCDPLAPSALALAAIDHLDLELAYLPTADPALKGARALFDEQSGTICCEASGDAAARALLLAHEIGHVEIHAGSATCRTGDIDPSRSTEAAPVGLQRVEDYGARERRELQADVFAREFLFPRALAGRIHVCDRLPATAIAERTGLPLALVRQQLFDALLLPSPPPQTAMPIPADTPRPDSSQDRAVTHRGCAVSASVWSWNRQDENFGAAREFASCRGDRSGSHPCPDILESCRRRAGGALGGRRRRCGPTPLDRHHPRVRARSDTPPPRPS